MIDYTENQVATFSCETCLCYELLVKTSSVPYKAASLSLNYQSQVPYTTQTHSKPCHHFSKPAFILTTF